MRRLQESREMGFREHQPLDRRKILAAGLAGSVVLSAGACDGPTSNNFSVRNKAEENLARTGVSLPDPQPAVGTYLPFRQAGDLVFIAGQGPAPEDGVKIHGKVGDNLSVAEGAYAARLTAYNLIAQARAACGGDLDRVKQWVRLTGFVNCTHDFTQQPAVIDGASEFLVEIFADKGLHARAAIGANALPFNIAVEVQALFQIKT